MAEKIASEPMPHILFNAVFLILILSTKPVLTSYRMCLFYKAILRRKAVMDKLFSSDTRQSMKLRIVSILTHPSFKIYSDTEPVFRFYRRNSLIQVILILTASFRSFSCNGTFSSDAVFKES